MTKTLFKINNTIKGLLIFVLFCTFLATGIMIKFEMTILILVPFIIYIISLFIANHIIVKNNKIV